MNLYSLSRLWKAFHKKDSTAMLLKMIEENIPIDCILFCDTGLEFPQMYEHIDKVEKETGLSITRVKAEKSFEYLMFDQPIKRGADSPITLRYGEGLTGHGWAGPKMRWCTQKLKDVPRERFLKAFKPYYEMRHYVGIAADEQKRLERKNNQNPNHVHPLVDWGMTEADCLEYCYSKGYDWGGLYNIFDRVSCWCCPLQSLALVNKNWTLKLYFFAYNPQLLYGCICFPVLFGRQISQCVCWPFLVEKFYICLHLFWNVFALQMKICKQF